MVIGNGMVAKRFESYKTNDEFLIFTSGVSNSKNINPEAYERELILLQRSMQENREKVLVYFSTCSIYDPGEENSKYVLHKKQIERLIQKDQKQFYIFRVSNLVGQSGNRNTILNFYVYHILNGINFDLWTNATRNLIDIDDMYKIADDILEKGVVHDTGNNNSHRKFVEHKSELHSYPERKSFYYRSVRDQPHHERTGYSFRKKLFN